MYHKPKVVHLSASIADKQYIVGTLSLNLTKSEFSYHFHFPAEESKKLLNINTGEYVYPFDHITFHKKEIHLKLKDNKTVDPIKNDFYFNDLGKATILFCESFFLNKGKEHLLCKKSNFKPWINSFERNILTFDRELDNFSIVIMAIPNNVDLDYFFRNSMICGVKDQKTEQYILFNLVHYFNEIGKLEGFSDTHDILIFSIPFVDDLVNIPHGMNYSLNYKVPSASFFLIAHKLANMKIKIVIATIKPWNIENAEKFKEKFSDSIDLVLITKKEDLNFEDLKKINPRYVFFPHWSWIIPKDIHENFECILFHMTDLPYGRGGSPLQNLIANKVYDTKISAIKVEQGLDTGDVYLKEPFYIGLESAAAIFQKISDIIFFKMIPFILKNNPKPVKQVGEPVCFKRRKPEQSEILKNEFNDLDDFYDFIRMLDADGYPKAFLNIGKHRILFSDVHKKQDALTGKFEIIVEK